MSDPASAVPIPGVVFRPIGGADGAHHVILDGYHIPSLMAVDVHADPIPLVFAQNIVLRVPRDSARAIIWFVANALAIGAGYTEFGANSQPHNPYRTLMQQPQAASEPEASEPRRMLPPPGTLQ